jgi:hypothetical protein
VLCRVARVQCVRTAEQQTIFPIDDPQFHLRKIEPMKAPTFTEKNILFRDVSCSELPVSDFMFQYSHNFQSTSGRLKIGLAFNYTTLKFVPSTSELHKLQNKH